MILEKNSDGLAKFLTPFGVLALTLGCCIGWGSFVMPGTTFISLLWANATAFVLIFRNAFGKIFQAGNIKLQAHLA